VVAADRERAEIDAVVLGATGASAIVDAQIVQRLWSG